MFRTTITKLERAGLFRATRQVSTVAQATARDWIDAFQKKGQSVLGSLSSLTPELSMVSSSAAENIANSPQLMLNVVSLQQAMRAQGLTPLFHAFPAAGIVPIEIEKALNPSSVFPLRPAVHPYIMPKEAAEKLIPTKQTSRNRQVLSTGYHLFSGLGLESPAGWLGAGHIGCEQNADIARYLSNSYKGKGILEQPGYKEFVAPKIEALIRGYGRLHLGDVAVIGVPAHLHDDCVYDAGPYNKPTGRSLEDVLRGSPEECIKDKNCGIAAILLCDKTLDPKSGLNMVVASDNEAVANFCQGMAKPNTSDLSHFPFPWADIKKDEASQRKELTELLKQYASIFAKHKDSPEKVVEAFSKIPEPEIEFDPHQDLPQSLP